VAPATSLRRRPPEANANAMSARSRIPIRSSPHVLGHESFRAPRLDAAFGLMPTQRAAQPQNLGGFGRRGQALPVVRGGERGHARHHGIEHPCTG